LDTKETYSENTEANIWTNTWKQKTKFVLILKNINTSKWELNYHPVHPKRKPHETFQNSEATTNYLLKFDTTKSIMKEKSERYKSKTQLEDI
jgi:hypothetical protein